MSDESPPDGDGDDYDPIFRADDPDSSDSEAASGDDPEAGDAVDAAFDPIEDGEGEQGDDAASTEDLFGDDDSGEGYELAANERHCSACGFVIDADAELCPECGARQGAEVAAGPDLNPILSAVLSFFLPGLGQLYNGQTTRAVATFVVWVAWLGAIVFGWLLITLLTGGLALVAVIVLPVIDAVYHGIAAVDAYVQAGKVNRGEKAP